MFGPVSVWAPNYVSRCIFPLASTITVSGDSIHSSVTTIPTSKSEIHIPEWYILLPRQAQSSIETTSYDFERIAVSLYADIKKLGVQLDKLIWWSNIYMQLQLWKFEMHVPGWLTLYDRYNLAYTQAGITLNVLICAVYAQIDRLGV